MEVQRGLPGVYLIGDSITGSYAQKVGRILDGEAVVEVRPENGEDSRNLLTRIPRWLSGKHFTLIHFNCGLHDIKRSHGNDATLVPIEAYEVNLRRIVDMLSGYADILVWACTTPVVDGQLDPSKNFNRFNRDVDAYNRCAEAVMVECGVPVNDLHQAVLNVGRDRCISEDGVHMTPKGIHVLSLQAAAAIRGALGS